MAVIAAGSSQWREITTRVANPALEGRTLPVNGRSIADKSFVATCTATSACYHGQAAAERTAAILVVSASCALRLQWARVPATSPAPMPPATAPFTLPASAVFGVRSAVGEPYRATVAWPEGARFLALPGQMHGTTMLAVTFAVGRTRR